MKINELKPAEGSRSKPTRVGRGSGSGLGKTSGRGHKGQRSRAGAGKGPGFEGGQMPLQRRIPKRGFTNRFAKHYEIVNLKDIEALAGIDSISPEVLLEHGLIDTLKTPVKILGDGDINRPVAVRANAFSASAGRKIKEAGGTSEVI